MYSDQCDYYLLKLEHAGEVWQGLMNVIVLKLEYAGDAWEGNAKFVKPTNSTDDSGYY